MEWDRDTRPGSGTRSLGEVLTDLFVARGYGRASVLAELESAWTDAVGPALATQTGITAHRLGVVTIAVSHPALLEELAAFRKAALLKELRERLPGTHIRDLRFRFAATPAAPSPTPPNPRTPEQPPAPSTEQGST